LHLDVPPAQESVTLDLVGLKLPAAVVSELPIVPANPPLDLKPHRPKHLDPNPHCINLYLLLLLPHSKREASLQRLFWHESYRNSSPKESPMDTVGSCLLPFYSPLVTLLSLPIKFLRLSYSGLIHLVRRGEKNFNGERQEQQEKQTLKI